VNEENICNEVPCRSPNDYKIYVFSQDIKMLLDIIDIKIIDNVIRLVVKNHKL
jgi:hypothetical protein